MHRATLLPGPSVPLINPDLLDIKISIPSALRAVFAANRRHIPKFGKAVVEAVKSSLEHSDTALRSLTSREVKRRVELCYEAFRIMHLEEKISLLQAFDILPAVLLDTLRMGYGVGDVTDGRGAGPQGRRWGVPGNEEVCEANLRSDVTEDDDV